MRVSALILIFIGIATAASAQSGPSWDYLGKYGPFNWGKLDPGWRVCSDGHQQSPIDIRGAHLNKNLQPIEFHFVAGGVTLVNDGHTIRVDVHPGSYMIAEGIRYDLQGLDFHHPSEEAVKGRLSEMSAHLNYKSADGKLAIVAVRLSEDGGYANAMLATLWQHLPAVPGQQEIISNMVNGGALLPADRGYWTYVGSLSTPPCTEGVRWFVMEQPVTISREQVRQFADIFRVNSRPLQDPHGRRIEANE